ncbi:Hypothetical protein PHPALM_9314 [Phytophthora palmivora]|uniref:Uncharacterized protein n=1 Tax=Phytophthora palmivora TaxID=4796 RepID=A0A2P4Y7L4_9STRA|nr:Hypothetical protein PHPALM_9314 [Phytophthora palmivora]
MGMILKTARSVPVTPSSAPKGLEKRKLGTAAKIRERKRAAARRESQGHVESGVQVACAVTNMSETAGAKAKKTVGGLFSEAIRAAMAEITEVPVVTASTVSSVASGSRTWEPLQQLLDDNFAEELDLVDRWKASSVAKFKTFWPKDEFGKRAIGAGTRVLCMFNALKRAAELAGRSDIVTQDDIDTFVADEFREHGVDLTHGTSWTWTVVLRFLRRLRDVGRDFIFKAIDKDNFTIADTVGLVYSRNLVGHAFVLSVQGKNGKTRQIFDLKDPKPVSSAMDWISFVVCIRPFVVFKKK